MLSGARAAPGIDEFLALRRRDERDCTGRYVIEGAHFAHAALRSRCELDGAVTCRALLSRGTRDAADSLRHRGVPIREITRAEYTRLTIAAEPSGLAAIVRQRWTQPQRPRSREKPVWLALGQIRSAGNLGTILRTALAAGVAGVLLQDEATDPFDAVAVRASMGAVMAVPLSRMAPHHLSAWKRRTGAVVVGTSASARTTVQRMPRGRPLVVVIGCERRGMSRAQRRSCDLTVSIPMAPGVSSLNVAVAAGVLLFGARRE